MDLTLIIGTCNSYLKYIPNCCSLVSKYFKPPVKKIIIGENEYLNITDYYWALPGKEQWGKRMRLGIEAADTKYVFFMLDDYYLSQKLTIEFISWLIQFMERENANKLSITPVPPEANYRYETTIDTIKKMSDSSDWLASVQPAIWKKDHILKVLQDDYDPWQFEIYGSEKLKGNVNNQFVIKVDDPIYFNFVRRGDILSSGWEEFLKSENLKLL